MQETNETPKYGRCRYCRCKMAIPERTTGDIKRFCSRDHKNLYHRYGPNNFESIFRKIAQGAKLPGSVITELAAQLELLVDARLFEALKVYRMEDATRRMAEKDDTKRTTDD